MFVYKYLFKVSLSIVFMNFLDEKLKGLLKVIKYKDGIQRERATSEFLKFYYPLMKRFFYGCFGMHNKENIEDFSQEILRRLIAGKTEINGSLLGYLYISAKRTSLNYLTSKYKKHVLEELPEELQSSEPMFCPELLADFSLKKNVFYERHERLRKKSIKIQFQMVLQGKPYKEVARILNMSRSSVKSNICRVRAKEGAIFFEKPRQEIYRA